ncbi:hypothetical protein RIF29_22996 [Crotalaria pallida]|uniref:Uncharacterized protein n=1 Tax=Crotalaria pallida TaxID=3830 RepID=A0AAN9F7R2_CROPI
MTMRCFSWNASSAEILLLFPFQQNKIPSRYNATLEVEDRVFCLHASSSPIHEKYVCGGMLHFIEWLWLC